MHLKIMHFGTFKIMYESPMKNFPNEDAGTGTGLKSSIRHISKPLQGIKDNTVTIHGPIPKA